MKSRDNGCLEYSKKKVVGEPDEGKPHVRFEEAGDGDQDMVELVRHSREEMGSKRICPAYISGAIP
jgi:hypothetical protein